MPAWLSVFDSAYVDTSKLSATDSSGSSLRPSGTTEIPAARTLSGRRWVTSTPSIDTVPPVVRNSPATPSARLDLPAPLGPRIAVTSPSGAVIETSRTTVCPPRATET